MVEAAPDLPPDKTSPAGFKEEMSATMTLHPENAHDFTFVRKETLMRLLRNEEAVEKSWLAWFSQRNRPQFYPGAVDALHDLRQQGYRLCAISDGNSKPMEIPELT